MLPRTPPRHRRLPAVALLLLLLGLAASAAPADAAWRGTPGKVAFLERDSGEYDLRLYEPKGYGGSSRTIAAGTFHLPAKGDTTPVTIGMPSAPAWSPDGTKLAFAAKVPDPGLAPGATHTAIFVWALRANRLTQVTTPPAGNPDPVPGDGIRLGKTFADFAPAWTPDGTAIAYLRQVSAAEDEGVHPQRGTNIRLVRATGADDQALTRLYGEQAFHALSWGGDPSGRSRLVATHSTPTSFRLVDVDPVSGAVTTIASGADAARITDFDVTPDGLAVDLARNGDMVRRGIDGGSSTPLGSGAVGGMLRSSPAGNGPLHVGTAVLPDGGQRAGLVERQAPDPSGDVWADDPQDRWVAGLTSLTGRAAYGTVSRSLFDVQPQRLPIVNIPGFAGSKIFCGGEAQWPPVVGDNGARLRAMTLDADGRTNANCPDAGPSADPASADGFVSKAVGKDIYLPQERFIEQIAPGQRGWRFSWDWRKRPAESVKRLDDLITRILDTDYALDQGLDRVVLYGHSYGGLLMREYLDELPHAQRVARILTVGTPFLGVPKPAFFVTFGVENPISGLADLDTLLPNAAARAFARNAAGAYHLFAADRFPAWMTRAGRALTLDETRAWLTGVGGANGALFDEGRAWHGAHDGFFTAGGLVQSRAVIGTGLLSIGSIEVPEAADEDGEVETAITMVDGDVTVPTRSAAQGDLASHAPLGDRVHVQAVCGVKHMALGGDPAVTQPYTEYLLTGRTPRKTAGACKPEGTTLEIREFELPGAGRRQAAAGAAPALSPSLVAASMDGRIQLIERPGRPVAVLHDATPVDLRLADGDRRLSVRVTRYQDGVAQPPRTFSGLQGDVRVVTGAGGSLAVTRDGEAVPPDAGAPGDPAGGGGAAGEGGATAGDAPGSGGGTPDGGGAAGDGGVAGASGGGPGTGPAPASRPALRLTGVRARRRGGVVVVTARGRTTATAVRVLARAGRARARVAPRVRAGGFTATVRLRRVRGRRVALTVTAPGAEVTRTVAVARR